MKNFFFKLKLLDNKIIFIFHRNSKNIHNKLKKN